MSGQRTRMDSLDHLLTVLGKHWHVSTKDLLLTLMVVVSTTVLLIKLMTGGADQAMLMVLSGLVGSITTMLTGHNTAPLSSGSVPLLPTAGAAPPVFPAPTVLPGAGPPAIPPSAPPGLPVSATPLPVPPHL